MHGKPNIDTLLIIFKQLKCNAQKVPTSLGGVHLGYLVLRAVPYATIPNTLPLNGTPTFIPSGPRVSKIEIIREKAAHDKPTSLYHECLRGKNTLCNCWNLES